MFSTQSQAVAAFESGVSPWEVSIKGALKTINNLIPLLGTQRSIDAWCAVLFDAVATHMVGNRPDRDEPHEIVPPSLALSASAPTKVTWREGTRQKLSSRFAAWRVRPAHKLSADKAPQPPGWLLVEWPADDDVPTRDFLSDLPPNTLLKRLVPTAKDRW